MSSFNDNSDWRAGHAGVAARNEYLLTSEKFSDVSFEIPTTKKGFKIVRAHKLMLMGASPVFEAMFNGHFVESNKSPNESIKVDDVDLVAFNTMLKFIYTGILNDCLEPLDLLGTIYVAKKYLISEIEEECSRRLAPMITKTTAITILQNAQLFENKELETASFSCIKSNFGDMLDYEELLSFSRNNLELVLSEPDIRVNDEIALFQAMLRWSVAECQRRRLEVTPGNQRNVLGDVIKFIQFPRMNSADLSSKIVPTNILTVDEVTLLFQHLSVPENQRSTLAPLPFYQVRRWSVYTVNLVEPEDLMGSDSDRNHDFSRGWTNAASFNIDKPIDLVGCGFYGPNDTNETSNSDVDLLFQMRIIKLSLNKNYCSRDRDLPGCRQSRFRESNLFSSEILKEFHNIQVKAKKKSIFFVDFENNPIRLEPTPETDYAVQFNIQGLLLPFSEHGTIDVSKTVSINYGDTVTFKVSYPGLLYGYGAYQGRLYLMPQMKFRQV